MSRYLLALLLGLITILGFASPAAAADPVVTDIQVEAADGLTVGDPFRVIVKIDADAGTTIFLAPGGLPNALALVSTPKVTSRSTDGRAEVTMDMELAAFLPGELVIPPIKLRYRMPGPNAATGEIETPPARLTVQSVLTPNDTEPRDLKAQAEIGSPPAIWVAVVFAAMLVALVVVVALLLLRRRILKHRSLTVEEDLEEVPDTPEDRARVLLDRAGAAFGSSGDYVPYYGAIAITVRDYLTERFGFHAFALTTRELQEEMVRRGVDRWQARIVGGLLTQCDAAVFAGYRPASERADADLTAAYEIVEMSRPAEPLVEVSVT